MAFADEPVSYTGRRFECGWDDRRQTASEIADRLVWFAQRLGTIDPAYGQIRPDPGPRKFRVGDLGPIVTLQRTDLVASIDKERFDPPAAPRPVGPGGFSLLYRNDVMSNDPSFVVLLVRAGRYGAEYSTNRVQLRPETKHELWRDIDRGAEIMDTLVETWEPQWACAYALAHSQLAADEESGSKARPWLAWTERPVQPKRASPYDEPYPPPFPLDHAGRPAEVRSLRGGELCIWP
jgi:hypothetical protein